MTSMPVTPRINEALPTEVLGVIFEEHAKLEWRAPVIDGQVCRQWRQTILRSPRAWTHLEIGMHFYKAPSELPRWLERSGTAPLHIQIKIWCSREILDQHLERFESLTVPYHNARTLLKGRSFPILQSFTVAADWDLCHPELRWSTWDAMPALRSLRFSHILVDTLPSKTFPALRVLALSQVQKYDYIIQNSYHSLTTLMLNYIDVPNTSEILEFPSLSFLSLRGMTNIKHRMNVPALTTYHEGGMTEEESFPMSLPLLTEYGIRQHYTAPLFTVTRLHQYYPNLSRISTRVQASGVSAFLQELSGQPTALPMLRLLAVGLEGTFRAKDYSQEARYSMMQDLLARNMATSVKMELCFDGGLRVPLYFGDVRVYIRKIEVTDIYP